MTEADGRNLPPLVEEMTRQLGRIDVAVRDLLAFARPALPKLEVTSVSEIAERDGGRLEVESDPGAGSRFRIVLPREGTAAVGPGPVAASADGASTADDAEPGGPA